MLNTHCSYCVCVLSSALDKHDSSAFIFSDSDAFFLIVCLSYMGTGQHCWKYRILNSCCGNRP